MNTAALAPELLTQTAWARRLAAELVRSDRDDLLQDAWLATAGRAAPAGVPPRRWLAGVMRNLARLRARGAARRRRREEAVLHRAASRPDEIAEHLEAQRLLAGLVLSLSPHHRDVILLRFHDDLPPREIAVRLGIPAGTARSRLSNALAELRGKLGERRRDWRQALLPLVGLRRAPVVPALVAVAAVVAVVSVPVWRALSGGTSTSTSTSRSVRAPRFALASVLPAAAPRLGAGDVPVRYQVPLGSGPVMGAREAMVTILELVDYECPFTIRAEAELGRVLARYAAVVRFQVIHRPLAFHTQAPLLARAALAADEQGRFWELHRRLLASAFERWTPERVETVAREAGLDVARFRRALDSEAVRARAAVDEATGTSAGVEGTPTFFVNGRALVGTDAPARMPAVIEEELARADSLLAAGTDRAALYNAAIAGGEPSMSTLPPPSARRRVSYEMVFTSGGSCSSPLEAPTALDFSSQKLDGRRRVFTAWSAGGTGSRSYRITTYPRAQTAVISSATAEPDDFFTFHQTISADAYRARRVVISAELKLEGTAVWSGFFLRASAADGHSLGNTRAPVAGPGWQPVTVSLTLPPDAKVFSFGLLLAGPGSLSARHVTFELTP